MELYNGLQLDRKYFKLCESYRKADLNVDPRFCHVHHIVPRCCGGGDEPQNLIKVTQEHHLFLHKKILASRRVKNPNGLSSTQFRKLSIAYWKLDGRTDEQIQKYTSSWGWFMKHKNK